MPKKFFRKPNVSGLALHQWQINDFQITRDNNRCRTCQHVSFSLTVNGPNCTINIKEHFSCHSSNLVYCLSCRRCPALYIGETGRTLRERLGEHLRSTEKKSPVFPVAEHFNGLDHTLSDAEIRGIKLCTGNNIHRKRLEMRDEH